MPVIPRVFVSAVSSDLRSARKVVNEALTQIHCLPVEESIAGTEYGRIRELLQRRIDPCDAVIHLVGRDYGGEPAAAKGSDVQNSELAGKPPTIGKAVTPPILNSVHLSPALPGPGGIARHRLGNSPSAMLCSPARSRSSTRLFSRSTTSPPSSLFASLVDPVAAPS